MVAAHPTIPGHVYAGNSHGLVVSDDGGDTWEEPETGPRDQRVLSFAFDPIHPATMYAGAWKGIFRSDNGGATWASSLDDETIWSIAVDPMTPDNVYVCTYHGVFKSADGGASWVQASTGLTAQYCWTLEVDPDDASTIYQGSDAGVFRSTNGGDSWSPFPGLERFRVYDLAFSPDNRTLFAATFGGGVAAYSFSGSACTLECSTIVPGTAFAGSEAFFQAESTAVGCAGSPTYEWTFGDGSANSTMQNIGHTYQAAGSYQWSMTAIADGVSCSKDGTIEVAPRTDVVVVPGAAHAPGAGGTSWRTDLAAVNRGSGQAALTLTYIPYDGGPEVERTHTLAGGHAVEWRDVLTTLFDIGFGDSAKGTIRIGPVESVFVTARTYNQTSTGTFGQYLPALPASVAAAALSGKSVQLARHGQVGVIPQLKKSADYRSNLGVQNLGAEPVNVEIKLFGADGSQLGETRTRTVATGRYWQLDDVFARLGAGRPSIAYATVEVLSADGLAWFYGSVVDNATGDPTTVPVLLPRAGSSGIAGIAHAPGTGGTTWRTDLAAVHLGSGTVDVELEFTKYNGGPSSSAQSTMAPGGTTEWRDVLVSLFGRDPSSVVKGTLGLGSMPDLYVTARTYNQTDTGTFGQYLPAVTAAEGFGESAVGVIPQLKNNPSFRSNLGVLNLSPFDVETAVTLFDEDGKEVGKPGLVRVLANEYFQIDDVFSTLDAGVLDVAYATVEVLTSGGRVWAYGSVVDNATGDPTTIPALTR
jgi:PKD repeat protein